MNKIGRPFIRYNCSKCGHEVERQVSVRRGEKELDEIRSGPPLLCAHCWDGTQPVI